MLMASARLDLSSVFLYAGSIAPGWVKLSDGTEKEITIIDSFEGVGACLAGRMSEAALKLLECSFAPGEAPCDGRYTANTLASVAQALDLSLPGSVAQPAAAPRTELYSHPSRPPAGTLPRSVTTQPTPPPKKAT